MPTFSLRIQLLLAVGLVVVLPPVATGMWLIQGILGRLGATLQAAPRDQENLEVDWRSTGRAVFSELLDLRGKLQRRRLQAGAVVGAATLATGALRLAVLAWKPTASFPPEYAVLYGGGSAPTRVAVQAGRLRRFLSWPRGSRPPRTRPPLV